MKPLRSMFFAVVSLAILVPATAGAQAPDAKLNAVLAQLDAASVKFKSARANFVSENYDAVVKETTIHQDGIIYFERDKGSMEMGMVVMAPKKKPGDKDVPDKVMQYKDGVGQLFDTSIDQIRVMNSGNQGQAQTFLTLGFGSTGHDLASKWNITYLGSETLTDGGPVKTEKLDLVSKDASVRSNYTHITIWIDPVRDVTLRQVFETPSHDRRTVNNSHIVLNGMIDKRSFAIKKGPHTTVVGP